MKGKFDTYGLWPLAQKFQNWIVDQSTACDFTVCKICWLLDQMTISGLPCMHCTKLIYTDIICWIFLWLDSVFISGMAQHGWLLAAQASTTELADTLHHLAAREINTWSGLYIDFSCPVPIGLTVKGWVIKSRDLGTAQLTIFVWM